MPAPKKGPSGLAWAGIGCGGILLIFLILGGILAFKGAEKLKEFNRDKELVIAEMLIATQPDVKKVSSDPGRGEITVRTKSGEEVTFNYKDIAKLTDQLQNLQTMDRELALAEIIIASQPDLEKVSSDPVRGEITLRSKAGEEYTVNYRELTEGRFSFKDSAGNTTLLGGSDDFSGVPSWVARPTTASGTPVVFANKVSGKAAGAYTVVSSQPFDDLIKLFERSLTTGSSHSSSSRESSLTGKRLWTRNISTSDGDTSVMLVEEGPGAVRVQVTYREK